jgi:hypothetical protein
MIAIVVFGLLFAGLLLFLLARYAPNPVARPGRAPTDLRALVRELLTKGMGFEVTDDEAPLADGRMQLTKAGPLGHTRYSVLLMTDPQGEIADQARILELVQTAAALHSQGMLIAPHRKDARGLGDLPSELELIDGPRLKSLVARYLPARSADLASLR